MSFTLNSSNIKQLLPRRIKNSHKGDNGRILIIGGDIDYYGAPILSGMGALNSGVDLVYLCVPECNFDVSRSFLPDFIVRSYPGKKLDEKALPIIVELAKKVDCVVIGPGISEDLNVLSVIKKIIKKVDCPLVLDAYAIQAIKFFKKNINKIIITPHLGEFAKLIGKNIPTKLEDKIKLTEKIAQEENITILLKGPVDIISGLSCNNKRLSVPRNLLNEKITTFINKTGNPGMTVGGSGDVLSGLTGGLLAQKADLFSAAVSAAYLLGETGDRLYREKGYCFTATDLALSLPYFIKNYQ